MSAREQLPGADWIYVDEGAELTPEQAARRFLDMPWTDQVAYMDRVQVEIAAGIACAMLNHEGAYIFATTHTCRPTVESECEARDEALAELERELSE